MRPSIFRPPNDSYPTKCLLEAEKDFAATLIKHKAAKRFRRPNLPALLQHYRCGPQWRLHGFMASKKFMFPDASEDNTRKLLEQPRTSKLLRETEKKYGFKIGTLGSL